MCVCVCALFSNFLCNGGCCDFKHGEWKNCHNISELTQSGAVLLEVRQSVSGWNVHFQSCINKVALTTNMDESTISRSLHHACSWEPFGTKQLPIIGCALIRETGY